MERHVVTGLAAGIAEAGHEIALHGWDHRLLPIRSPFAVTGALPRAHRLVRDVTGQSPAWYRPPYGAASGPAMLAAHFAYAARVVGPLTEASSWT